MVGLKRIFILAGLVLGLWSLGIFGYMFLEGWNLLDSIYMTAITFSTVGYGEVHPLNPSGRIFTAILVVLGVGLFYYAIGILIDSFIEGHVRGFLEKRRMEKKIRGLNGHYIVCGYGRIGRSITRTLSGKGEAVVVIENDPNAIKRLEEDGCLWIEGDATRDEVLDTARVKAAKGIVCVLKSDADNVYITITARWLNPGLFIVARATDPRAQTKLIRAGADKVILPYEIGAQRMALTILQPTVTEFLDLAVHSSDFGLGIEQIEIQDTSEIKDKTIKDSGLRQRYGVTVLAVHDPNDQLILSPDPDFTIRPGNVLVVLGSTEGLERFRDVAKGLHS